MLTLCLLISAQNPHSLEQAFGTNSLLQALLRLTYDANFYLCSSATLK